VFSSAECVCNDVGGTRIVLNRIRVFLKLREVTPLPAT
jgi:hypothetical protein